jgi:hypothetical protein
MLKFGELEVSLGFLWLEVSAAAVCCIGNSGYIERKNWIV